MKFECGDLERALAVSELMPEAREHLKHCAACRREYRVWNDISTAAKDLHEDWESAALWPTIRNALEAEPKVKSRRGWWTGWKILSAAAAVLVVAAASIWLAERGTPAPNSSEATQVARTSADRDFLTDQALQEVEKTEAAYRQSIQKLSRLAEPVIRNPVSAVAVNYREKLLMLDSAITETRANLDHNRFNVRLQTELADLYREKQQTLRELLTRDQKN